MGAEPRIGREADEPALREIRKQKIECGGSGLDERSGPHFANGDEERETCAHDRECAEDENRVSFDDSTGVFHHESCDDSESQEQVIKSLVERVDTNRFRFSLRLDSVDFIRAYAAPRDRLEKKEVSVEKSRQRNEDVGCDGHARTTPLYM